MEFGGKELSQKTISSAIRDIILGDDSEDKLTISEKDGFRALQKSILEVGTITNPIIIQKLENKENNFEYIVVEGNTRLTIRTELNQEFSNKGDNRWDKIPCQIIRIQIKNTYIKYN